MRRIRGPANVAASTRMSCVAADTSLAAAPRKPAMHCGSRSSAMTRKRGSSSRSSPSSVCIVSPSRASRTISRAARNAIRIVNVQRLTAFEHDEIRNVDDVVDRSLAGERKAHAHPKRGWSDVHVRDMRCATKRLQSPLSIRTLSGGVVAVPRDGRPSEGSRTCTSERCAEFAREAEHRHRVDAIRRHFDIENGVAKTERRNEIRTGRHVAFELQDAVVEPRRFEADLIGRTQACLLKRCRASCAARCACRRVVRPAVRRARTDRSRRLWRPSAIVSARSLPTSTVQTHKPVRGGVLLDGRQSSDDDAGKSRPRLDRRDGEAEPGEMFAQSRRGSSEQSR